MAFAVICKSCQARFLLNDDLLRRKVAGRVVTVRCRQCHAPIEVDASLLESPGVATATKPDPPGPPPAPSLTAAKAPLNYKPAPSPPRPAKSSTLMGIGAPRPGSAPEMVALSPGLLNMPALSPGPRGFPEPPPPPSSIEDISGDWEIPELKTPAMPPVEATPESVDDFIEELPPSLPPPATLEDEDEPTVSIGAPALSALIHHSAPRRETSDDFFGTSGDTAPLAMNAPTIDVSALSTAQEPSGPSIDLSSLDVPRGGKQTLPLFSGGDPLRASSPLAAAPNGSLGAPSLEPPAPSHRPDSVRSRRNVVAPETKSDPPSAPAPRRSVVALPVLLVLAATAGFLIWKRAAAPAEVTATTEPAPRAEPAPPTPAPEAGTPAEPAAVAAATTVADDVTFEKAAPRAVDKSSPHATTAKPQAPATTTAPAETPARKPAAEAPLAPTVPTPKAEPDPSIPSEPSGPFDRAAAAAALTSAASAASTCRKEGDPSGTASVVITFAPSGRVTSANLGGPPFAGTATGGCIAAALRKARVPPFEGERVTVSKTIVVQ